jgi:hypothetical protein
LGNADRKNYQVLSTVFLRMCEKVKFEYLITMTFFFTLVDYENETFYKKIIDEIKLQMMCIKNFMDGNENMKNLIGLIDTKLVDKLDNEVKFNLIKNLILELRYPKTLKILLGI